MAILRVKDASAFQTGILKTKDNNGNWIIAEDPRLEAKTEAAYNAGFEAGKAEGGDGNAEQIFDEFASTVQLNGTRTDFSSIFKKSTITDETISEIFARWNSTIKTSSYMFEDATNLQEGLYTDALDFSQSSSLLSAFHNTNITKLKKIDARKTVSGWNGMANIFLNCKSLESVDEFYPSTQTNFSGTFMSCFKLKHVIFKSIIAVMYLTLADCSFLDKESIESVVMNLSDETDNFTITLSKTAVANAFKSGEAPGIQIETVNNETKISGPFVDFYNPTEITDYYTSIPYTDYDESIGRSFYTDADGVKFILLKDWNGKKNWTFSFK